MDTTRQQVLEDVFAETIRLHEQVRQQDAKAIFHAVDAIGRACFSGGRVLAFGNGGSAADSQHFAAELVGRFMRERRALAAIALTTDTSILTALGNDYSYDRVFARQVEALGHPADVALGISTSGRSANVLRGLETARGRKMVTIALTGGDGGPIGQAADIHINVPAASAARVQEVHRTLLHLICELVERDLERHA